MNIELLREEASKILPKININEMQKTYLDIKKININEYLRESQIPENSIIVLREDEERTKLSLINVDIDIIDTQNRIINMKTLLKGKEISKAKNLGKSILNILNIDNYSKENYEEIIKRRKKEKEKEKKSENIQKIDGKEKNEKKEEDKKSEKEEKDTEDKERDDKSDKEWWWKR